jgi:hypothetical protein
LESIDALFRPIAKLAHILSFRSGNEPE